jgi:hypothetical protein
VVELAEEGMTQREIADVLGVGQKTVSRDLESNDSAELDVPVNDGPERGAPESNDSPEPGPTRPALTPEQIADQRAAEDERQREGSR